MKKRIHIYVGIIWLLLFLIVPNYLYSQVKEPVIHWSQPAAFIPSEEVSFYFDVTGTKLEGENAIYIHSWFPSDQTADVRPESELALTHIEGNVWRFDMTPTEFYERTADQIYESGAFYGMLRTADWSKADVFFTPDIEASQISIPDLTAIKGDKVIEAYPANFTQDKPVSFLINAHNTWSNNSGGDCVSGELNNADQVVVHSGVNDWEIVTPSDQPQAKLTKIDDGIWRMDMILKEYYSLPEDYNLENINMVFASTDWQWQGIDIGCNDFKIYAPDIPIPPPPSLYFFPLKISINDILIITRDNNDRGQRLSYTITGGDKTISGELEGAMTRQRAFINIAEQFKGKDLSKINVLIKDQNEKVIYDGEMPLVEVDNLIK